MSALFPLAPSTTHQGEWGPAGEFHHPASHTSEMGHSQTFKSGQSAWHAILLHTCNRIHHFRNWIGCAALCNGCAMMQLVSQSSRKHALLLPHSRRAQVPGLINSVCLLLQTQRLVGHCLHGRHWPCVREVLSPEGPIMDLPLGLWNWMMRSRGSSKGDKDNWRHQMWQM